MNTYTRLNPISQGDDHWLACVFLMFYQPFATSSESMSFVTHGRKSNNNDGCDCDTTRCFLKKIPGLEPLTDYPAEQTTKCNKQADEDM